MPYDDVYVCGCVCMARFKLLTLNFHNRKKDRSFLFVMFLLELFLKPLDLIRDLENDCSLSILGI